MPRGARKSLTLQASAEGIQSGVQAERQPMDLEPWAMNYLHHTKKLAGAWKGVKQLGVVLVNSCLYTYIYICICIYVHITDTNCHV